MTGTDAERLAHAERLAEAAHAGQTDKLGVAYINHVRAVADAVAPLGADCQIVALLHDCLEDCDDRALISARIIADSFGAEIAAGVDAMTRRPGEGYVEDYLPRLLANPLARAVKRADVQHNRGRLHLLPAAERARLDEKYRAIAALLGD